MFVNTHAFIRAVDSSILKYRNAQYHSVVDSCTNQNHVLYAAMSSVYEKSSPASSIEPLILSSSVVFHLSSLLSWSYWNSCHMC
jgi:hypothetical protein